eukprot:scaffold75237_cov12-Tisochrysis_lutea.AAC.1
MVCEDDAEVPPGSLACHTVPIEQPSFAEAVLQRIPKETKNQGPPTKSTPGTDQLPHGKVNSEKGSNELEALLEDISRASRAAAAKGDAKHLRSVLEYMRQVPQ